MPPQTAIGTGTALTKAGAAAMSPLSGNEETELVNPRSVSDRVNLYPPTRSDPPVMDNVALVVLIDPQIELDVVSVPPPTSPA